MSGPKRSDVTAALHQASASADSARRARAESDARALKSLGESIDKSLRVAADAAKAIPGTPVGLSGAVIDAANAGRRAVEAALGEATNAQVCAMRSVSDAQAADQVAAFAFDKATRELEDAQRALAAKQGQHNLHAEFAKAQAAKASFDVAKRQAEAAAGKRSQAKSACADAVTKANSAGSAARQAASSISAALSAELERRRREEEARRIAEAALRAAAEAAAAAGAAVSAVPSDDAAKFAPADLKAVRGDLEAAQRALARNDAAGAQNAAKRARDAAPRLAERVRTARGEFDKSQAAAKTAIATLEAAIAGADPTLINDWSDQPNALRDAKQAMSRAGTALNRETFDVATDEATKATKCLNAAANVAAEAHEANDRRNRVGQSILETLEAMHFDVSFEPGTRDGALRIAGETAEADGRGSFDIQIPLSGEVHFEVQANRGDVSCVAAVTQLQERLATQGVGWTVTDWGQAKGAKATGGATNIVNVKNVVTENVRTN
jgi:hypothetical protein